MSLLKNLAAALLVSACLFTDASSGRESSNPLDEMLAKAGLKAEDLGFRPKSYWTRFPNPRLIPYKPVLFDDLFAEPFRIYDVVQIMALACGEYLAPSYREKNANALYKTAYFIGFEKKTGTFRAYGSALSMKPAKEDPLLDAFRTIFERGGRVFDHQVLGKPADWPKTRKNIKEAVELIHPELRVPLAQALLSLVEARHWVDVALRNVDREDLLEVWRIRDLSETQFDAMDYYPEVDDAARALDEQSLYYGAMKVIEASEILKRDLESALAKIVPEEGAARALNVETPFGRVVVAGEGDDKHAYSDAMLIVDLGGADTYAGPAGATPRPDIPVALLLDLGGNDHFVNEDRTLPAQGAALFGAAVLLDCKGDDVYESRYLSQGAGQFGAGLLADLEGDDVYRMEVAGQGAGLFGVGLLMDLGGRDEYCLCGDGQGYGGVGGVGTLVDRSGDDLYYAEPKAEKFFRPDYHGWMEYNYSYAQGAGIGRRGDISDGHSWAGGMGTLIDLDGNDRYVSGTWSLGSAYWFGIGLCYDRSGNDVYESCTFAQASGAHFCVAALIDEGGDDRHTVYGKSTCCVGFGHDYTVALLLDRSGDDVYETFDGCLGRAIRVSQAFFLDLEGNDCYRVKEGAKCLGSADRSRRGGKVNLDFTYEFYSRQVGLFLDGGGEDRYAEYSEEGEDKESPRFRNGAAWFDPGPGDPECEGRRFGLGWDGDAGPFPPTFPGPEWR